MHDLLNSVPSLVGVLDLGTGVDPVAAALVGAARSGLAGRPALHRVRAAALLTARTSVDGVAIDIRSRHLDAEGEDDLLASVDADLFALRSGGGVLVTYNGRRFDLPTMRRRLARHMLFGSKGVRCWLEREGPHVDLMTDLHPHGTRWVSLQDEAAGLGIPMPVVSPKSDAARTALQCEADCAVTFLVYLHAVASATGQGAPLLASWRGLAALIDDAPDRWAHLQPLRRPVGVPEASWVL